MTFYEAALEVLRRHGRPLHYKKITEIAIRDNLLSHVGKTPDVTMSSLLNREVKRESTSNIIRTRPGVFTLNEEFARKLNESQKLKPAPVKAKEPAPAQPAPPAQAPERQPRQPESAARQGAEDLQDLPKQAQPRNHAKSLEYPEDPELFGDEQEQNNHEQRRSRRRRGRRGGRSSEQQDTRQARNPQDQDSQDGLDSAQAPAATVAAAPTPEATRQERPARPERQEARQERPARQAEQPAQAPQAQRPRQAQTAQAAEPFDLDGIAQAAHTVLRDNQPNPMSLKELAHEIFERKLVRFHTHDAAMTVRAAMLNDNQRRAREGHRELFVSHGAERWSLSEWGMSPSMLDRERRILELAHECRQEASTLLGHTLSQIPNEALEHIALTLLEGLNYNNIKVSKRSSNGDVFFSAQFRQGLSHVRVCIQLVGDLKRELERVDVTELRGTLHHYSACEGVIIHFGQISREALEESQEEKLAPMTLIDRQAFVGLMIHQGIGVRSYSIPMLMLDHAYLDAIKS